MTDTDMLYMASLEKRLADTEAENAALKQRISELESKHHNECAQIAHYDDELRKAKELLKAAVEDIQDMLYQVDSVTVCTHCIHTTAICYGGSDCEHEAKWTHLSEALALIGEDINVTGREDGDKNA